MLIFAVATVLFLLLISEWWWRKKRPHGEISRKFVHITVGSFAASWPYFLSWSQILLLSLAFIVVVGVSQYFNIFKAIHAVERPTWGEICFALAVGSLALFVKEPLLFTIALLHMSLADGLAAIIGTIFGKKTGYVVLGHRKSIVGTLTFFFVSFSLLLFYATVVDEVISPVVIVGLAAAASALENVAVRGLDNLAVPLVVALVLLGVS
jgi:dolichol kinase